MSSDAVTSDGSSDQSSDEPEKTNGIFGNVVVRESVVCLFKTRRSTASLNPTAPSTGTARV